MKMNQTFIRMIRCPICSSPLHFYMNFYKVTKDTLRFARYHDNTVYDRKCNSCNIAFRSVYFKYGGKESIKRVIKKSKRNHDLSKVVYTSNDYYCEIKHIEEYLLLTPYKERVQDIPFEEGIRIPSDFHQEFIEYKRKLQENEE
jgi:C4-type Zn-finger protein